MKKTGIFNAFAKGFSLADRKRRIIIYLWIINLLFAAVAAAPIYSLIKKDLAPSLMGDRMLEKFDFFWLGDFVYKYSDIFPVILTLVLVPLIVYMLLNIFLSGGIIGRLNDEEERVRLKDFFADCGRYFWRFFRLFLLSIPVYLIFVMLLNSIAGAVMEIFTKNAVTEWPSVITANLKIVIFVLLFSIVNMVLDYTKIKLVLEDSTKVFKGFWHSVKFVFRRFFKAWALYLMVGLIFVIVSFIYLEVSTALPGHTMTFIVLTFILHQAYIMLRLWVKLDFYAAQMSYYRAQSPEPEPQKTPN
jgi:hypothetical protein